MLEADVSSAGWRSWPSVLVTAVDMWLHPVVWPAGSTAQRRRRAVAMALTATVASGVIGRAVVASVGPLPRQAQPAWNLTDCAVLLFLGTLLILLPLPTGLAVAALLRRTVRALSVPAVLLSASLIAARAVDPVTMPMVHAPHPQPTAPSRAIRN
jgi:hypothetical protein